MAGWIKMPHGREVGLGPGHIGLDGDPAPLQKKGDTAPNFRPICIVAKLLDVSSCQGPSSMEEGLGQGDIVLDGDPPPRKGHGLPIFGPYPL